MSEEYDSVHIRHVEQSETSRGKNGEVFLHAYNSRLFLLDSWLTLRMTGKVSGRAEGFVR